MNIDRNIDDAMLSAYLDGELPAQDMQALRVALERDSVLAQRFNALKLANDLVLQHARALDDVPQRAATLAMLQTDAAAPAPANVVRGPWLRWSHMQRALAAGVVIAVGLAVSLWREPARDALPTLATYAEHLDTAPSGSTLAVDDATLVTRFSFRDGDNRYCRQYQLSTATAGSQNVACMTDTGWTLVASLAASANGDAYQPASSSAELNALLDAMMQGDALDLATEATLIEQGWQE